MIFEQSSQSRDSILLMEWDKQRLSFSVFHEPDNRVLRTWGVDVPFNVLESNAQEIERFLKLQDILSYQFEREICLLNHAYHTLIPNAFYNAADNESYLAALFTLPNGHFETDSAKVMSSDYQSLFIVPKNLQIVLNEIMPQCKFLPTANVLMQTYAKIALSKEMFYMHLGEDLLYISFYSDNALKFHNAFHFLSAEDVIYHVQNVFIQLGLSNENQNIYISGALIENGNIHKLMNQYFRYVNLLGRSHKINYSANVAEIPAHYFTHHYTVFL